MMMMMQSAECTAQIFELAGKKSETKRKLSKAFNYICSKWITLEPITITTYNHTVVRLLPLFVHSFVRLVDKETNSKKRANCACSYAYASMYQCVGPFFSSSKL